MIKFSHFFKTDIFKAFFTTGFGVGTAQLIALLSVPYIAQISGPESFGKYSVYNSLLSIFCVFASLKLEFAVYTIPWRLYPYLKILVSYLLLVNSVLFGVFAALWLKIDVSNIQYTLSFTLSIFSMCYAQFVMSDNIKCGYYKKNAYIRITRALSIIIIFSLISKFYKASPLVILLSFSLGNLLPSLAFKRINFKSPVKIFRNKKPKTIFLRCKKVIIFLVPAHFLSRYSSGSLIILSGFMGYHASEIAKYALVEKLIIAPAAIVTMAMSDVIKRELVVNPRNGLKKFYLLSTFTSLMAVVGCIAIIIFGSEMLNIFMGKDWNKAIDYAIAIMPYFVSLLILSPITHTYTILNKQQYDLAWQVFHSLIITCTVVIGLSQDMLSAVLFYSIVSSFSILISALICRKIILNHKMNSD